MANFHVVKLPHCPLHVNLVANLVDQNSMDWNHQLVHYLFPSSPARIILSIPVVPMGTLNSLVWNFEQNGQYSVKSGYKYLIQ